MIRKTVNYWVGLYENYGLKVACKTAIYTNNVTNETYDIITDLLIVNQETREVIYHKALGNRWVKLENVSRVIDNLLFYLTTENLHKLEVENIIEKVIIDNITCEFIIKTNKMIEAKKEHDNKTLEIVKAENLYKKVIELADIKKMNIYYIDGYIYLITFKDNKTKNIFDNLNNKKECIDLFNGKDLQVHAMLQCGLFSYDNRCGYTNLQAVIGTLTNM